MSRDQALTGRLPRQTKIVMIVGASAISLSLLVALVWWFQQEEGPAAVDLETAVARLEAAKSADAGDADAGDMESRTGAGVGAVDSPVAGDGGTADGPEAQPGEAEGPDAGTDSEVARAGDEADDPSDSPPHPADGVLDSPTTTAPSPTAAAGPASGGACRIGQALGPGDSCAADSADPIGESSVFEVQSDGSACHGGGMCDMTSMDLAQFRATRITGSDDWLIEPTPAAGSGGAGEDRTGPAAGSGGAGQDGTGPGRVGEDAPEPGDIAGLWVLESTDDPDIDLTGEHAVSFAGFRVNEVLARGIGDFTAVGRTPDVSGLIQLDDTALTEALVAVDFTTLRTDNNSRDRQVQKALSTAEFPIAVFTLTEPVELSDRSAFSGAAVGNLTIKGATNRAEFKIEAKLVDDTLVVVGSSPVTFADYGVSVPSAPIVVSAEDHGIIEFQLFFKR